MWVVNRLFFVGIEKKNLLYLKLFEIALNELNTSYGKTMRTIAKGCIRGNILGVFIFKKSTPTPFKSFGYATG